MRRILRKIAENDYGALGDTSTLADPAVVDDLIENRMNRETDRRGGDGPRSPAAASGCRAVNQRLTELACGMRGLPA